MESSRALARVTAGLIVLGALAPVAVVLILLSALMSLKPPAALAERPAPGGQVSRVFDANGDPIGEFREFEQNRPVRRADIPRHLKLAVVAAEDKNFYKHKGYDLPSMLRALWADVQGGEIRQGGSTITQQFAKNAYTGSARSLERKFREAIIARELSRTTSKDEILFRYLSTVYLGQGAYGVGAASETYFRKGVEDLTLSEAALLAGLIPAPSRYDPRANPGLAEFKRRLVLDRMLEQGYISSDEHAGAMREQVWLGSRGAPVGPATVVHPPRQPVSKHPYFVDYVRRYLEETVGRDELYRGGLTIRTTIDPKAQAAAEAAVAQALDGILPPIEMALVAVEPSTGHVRAMVGGRDFNAPDGQVNLALGNCPNPPREVRDKLDVTASCWDEEAVTVEGGGTGRQPGSSWKPVVLAAALEKGIPDGKVYSAPGTYRIPGCRGDFGCVVENFEGTAGGRATLRRATHKSYNTVYVQVIRDVGIKETGEMAKKLGITSAWVATPQIHGPSYALGAQEVAPLDMASAYGVFAMNGMRARPSPVLWVRRPDGRFRIDNRKPKLERVLDAQVAYNVTDILKGVITEGTGTAANIGRPAAGKTGTAQEFRDAWFIGYTPALSTSVWIGNKQKPTPLLGVKGVERVTGGSIPAQTWNAFMSAALAEVPPEDFRQPEAPPPPPPAAPTPTPPTTLFPAYDPYPTTTWTPPSYLADTTTSTSTTSSTTTTTTSPGGTGILLPRRTSTTTTTTQPPTTTTTTQPQTTTTGGPPTTRAGPP